MNVFKKIRQRRERRRKEKELAQMSYVFGLMRKLEKTSMIVWNAKTRQLFIAEPLALVIIAQGYERWQTFLNNVFLHRKYQLQRRMWDDYVLGRQKRAIADFRKQGGVLTKAEIERIKRAVRSEVSEDDVSLPSIEPFDFFIIADRKDDKPHNAITWVGTYNPEDDTFDMAEWEDVKHNFNVLRDGKEE